MAKLVQATKKNEKGTSKIVCGNVCKIKEGTGAGEGKVVTVSVVGDVWDAEKKETVSGYVNASFWNSEKNDDVLEGKNQRADMVRKLKLQKGQFIMMSIFETADGNNTYGNSIIKGSGTLNLLPVNEDDKGITVILGSVTRTNLNKENGVCGVTVIANSLVKDVGFETVNHEISFWNSEDAPNRAEKVNDLLAPKENEDGTKTYARIVAVCGEKKEDTVFDRKDGSKGYGATYAAAFRFDFAPKKKKSNPSNDTAEPANDDFQTIPDGIEDNLPWQ